MKLRRARALAIATFLASMIATDATAECVSRGVWHKEVYCTGGSSDYIAPEIYEVPTIDQQVAALVAEARALMQQNNLLGAVTQLEAALRLNPSDVGANALSHELAGRLGEERRRAEREQLAQRVHAVLGEAEQLEALGRLDEAMKKADEAYRLNTANTHAYEYVRRLKGKIEAAARNERERKAAIAREEYQQALARAQKETQAALRDLSSRLQRQTWRHLATTAAASRAAEQEAAAGGAALETPSAIAGIGFDRLDSLLSGPALDKLGAPNSAPVAPRTPQEQMIRLIDQVDYLEGLERALDTKIAAESDPAKRGALRVASDIVRGIKATARVKLINLATTAPKP